MTRQNNETSAVPQGSRKKAVTKPRETLRGGKGIQINQQVQQLTMNFGTAENPCNTKGATDVRKQPQRRFKTCEAPQPRLNARGQVPAKMEEVIKITKHLIQLEARRQTVWRSVYAGRKSMWALSHSPAVDRGL